MFKQISYIKDSVGQPYIGIKFTLEELENIINQWKNTFNLGLMKENDKLSTFIDNKINRDGHHYHLTVINAMEWKSILKNSEHSLEELEKIVFPKIIDDIHFEGIGKAINNNNEAHFIVVKSDFLDLFRDGFNLTPKDFHITLGFDKKDVHGVSKGVDSIFKIIN